MTDTDSEFVLKATALVDVISPVDTRLSLYMPTRLTITIRRLMHTTTEYETSRLVFTARLRPQFRTPPVTNARSPECPRPSIPARRRAAGSIRISISRRASCCCSSAIAGIAIGANFKIYLIRQFCSNRAHFLQYTGDTDAKMVSRILKFEFGDFSEFFEIFKKAADLHHYGRGQTRSQ